MAVVDTILTGAFITQLRTCPQRQNLAVSKVGKANAEPGGWGRGGSGGDGSFSNAG